MCIESPGQQKQPRLCFRCREFLFSPSKRTPRPPGARIQARGHTFLFIGFHICAYRFNMFYMILSLTTSNGVQRKGGLEHRCNRKFGRFCLRGWFRASDNNAALVTHLRAQPQRTDSPESFLTVRVAFVETKCLSGIHTPTYPTNRLGMSPSKRPPLDTATPCLPEEFRSLAACI